MKKYFPKNTKIKFFIWRGVFLFDEENNLLAVAGSAGSRYGFTSRRPKTTKLKSLELR